MKLSISNGYVIYQRGEDSKSPFWKMIYNRGAAEAAAINSLYHVDGVAKYASAGRRLIDLGEQEQAKEAALIERATGTKIDSSDDIKFFIESFNQILMGKEQFNAALKRLQAALSKTNQKKGARAPTIASWFTSYLGTALNKNISAFIRKNADDLLDKNFAAWDEVFDDLIDASIDQAFKQMLTKMEAKEGKELYGERSTWEELYNISQQLEGFNPYFREVARSVINFDQIRNIVKAEGVRIKSSGQLGVKKFIESNKGLNLKNEKRSRAIGGSVEEVLMQLANNIGKAAQKAASAGGKTFTSNIMTTDNVTLYQFEQTIETDKLAQAIVDVLENNMRGNTSLEEARRKMEAFSRDYLSHLDDAFIVYGSTKSYSMSNTFSGFHAGGKRSLESAVDVLTHAGVESAEAVDKYIKAAYNTGEGAILEGRRAEIQDDLKTALMSSIAELLFDDWSTIGEIKGGAQAIHVLQLEGIQIPLSVLLIATGKAMVETFSEMEQFVKVSMHLPGKITYPDVIQPETDKPMNEIIEKWNEQAQLAKNESYFSVRFLKNFKSVLLRWVDII